MDQLVDCSILPHTRWQIDCRHFKDIKIHICKPELKYLWKYQQVLTGELLLKVLTCKPTWIYNHDLLVHAPLDHIRDGVCQPSLVHWVTLHPRHQAAVLTLAAAVQQPCHMTNLVTWHLQHLGGCRVAVVVVLIYCKKYSKYLSDPVQTFTYTIVTYSDNAN